MRQINDTDLVGKTIKSIDTSSVNVLKITFSDDQVIELWAEHAVETNMGWIPGIFIEDNPDPNIETIRFDHGCGEGCAHDHE